MEFLLKHFRREDGRFFRTWHPDQAILESTNRPLALAEDYAALLETLLTLSETQDVRWLPEARSVGNALLDLFYDSESGGFYSTGRDAETLIVRPKEIFDNAVPSPNSLAASGLLRLAILTGDDRYRYPAIHILNSLAPDMQKYSLGFAYALTAAEWAVFSPIEVAIIGNPQRTESEMFRSVYDQLVPASVILTHPTASDVSPLLVERNMLNNQPTGYVCENYVCRNPVTDPRELRTQIDVALAARRNS